ncbi:uncharacterized protein LOC123709929 [Pieris brassicae]|uniref:Uncharacterized protein n=1 Tax=Pieris brassicae TaxID=7116 RepID=A0A9P0X830_PIEBR|nr:uncharacterized protein LOC123709929 [Pieris brassicae]CAH4027609.1 unnamed protein product [Pieris brassicae]
MKIRVLYLTVANILITMSYAKLNFKTTDKSCDRKTDVKPDVVAKDQNGAHYNYFNTKRTIRAVDDKKTTKNVTNNNKSSKDKVLVKKPIPKFHEISSDEDYQSKYKWMEKQESAEHEDEDFNINDYDFDINHDEFVSGRKPLEPRNKNNYKRPRINKAKSNPKADTAPKPKLPRSLIQRKVTFPKKPIAVKVIRNTAEKMREEDYDQEFSTSTQVLEETTHGKDDSDESDEIDDGKEFLSTSYVRTVRSPWNLSNFVEKLGERTSNMMSKLLSHLPIFPQIPYAKKDEIVTLDEPVKNPLRGR